MNNECCAVEKLKLFYFLSTKSLFSFCEWVLHGRVKFLPSSLCVFVLPSPKLLSFQAASAVLPSGREINFHESPCFSEMQRKMRSKISFRNRFQIVQCLIGEENWIPDKIVCCAITKRQQIPLYLESAFIPTAQPPQTFLLRPLHRNGGACLKIELITIRILLCSPSSCCWCTQISFVRLSSVAVRERGGKWLSSVNTFSSPRTIAGPEIAPRKATSLPLKQIKTPKFR